MIRTSMSEGAVSKVCVGTMDCEKVEPMAAVAWCAVETGERVAARMERCSFCVMARMFRASRGPATSRSWKPGKRTMAIFEGGEG
jgi:hypothetical protein